MSLEHNWCFLVDDVAPIGLRYQGWSDRTSTKLHGWIRSLNDEAVAKVNALAEILRDPLTHSPLQDPVLAGDILWERKLLKECRSVMDLCPFTGRPFGEVRPHLFASEMMKLFKGYLPDHKEDVSLVAVADESTELTVYDSAKAGVLDVMKPGPRLAAAYHVLALQAKRFAIWCDLGEQLAATSHAVVAHRVAMEERVVIRAAAIEVRLGAQEKESEERRAVAYEAGRAAEVVIMPAVAAKEVAKVVMDRRLVAAERERDEGFAVAADLRAQIWAVKAQY